MSRYTLTKSSERPLWWVLTDTENGLVCRFEEGKFNDTQDFTFVEGIQIDMMGITRHVTEMTDWLRENHYELVFTSPATIKAEARKSIGEQLREAREAKGWTVRDVARLTGITFTHVARIERGKYNVNLDTVAVIAAALGMDITLE